MRIEPDRKQVMDLASDLLLIADCGRHGYAEACARDASEMLLLLLDQAMRYRSEWSSCSIQSATIQQERDDYKRGKDELNARAIAAEQKIEQHNRECAAMCEECLGTQMRFCRSYCARRYLIS